ncbi:hypothetical protein [uncultured Nitratireductor sp.]|uniref:hypothetical protein n=1 Tax=uncultured Nitratireductor sp. TaxID=520953 RepID=UPI0025F04FE5|nr:hypothetical protein [uncultured Nitratireductor sp.]
MPKNFTQELLEAAEKPNSFSQSELQSLLRRAALCLDSRQNPGGSVLLIQEVAEMVDKFANEHGMSRDEGANALLLEWGVDAGIIEIDDLEEEDE